MWCVFLFSFFLSSEASKIALQYLVCGASSSIEVDFLKEQLINANLILEGKYAD